MAQGSSISTAALRRENFPSAFREKGPKMCLSHFAEHEEIDQNTNDYLITAFIICIMRKNR